jgi:2,4-diketo-3-deoxy-L-fuconate hydrolase
MQRASARFEPTDFGLGVGLKPPKFPKKGDIVPLGMDGLGAQQQLVVPFKR